MTRLEDLRSLLERVERATGPDREIDLELAANLVPDVIVGRQQGDVVVPFTHWEYTGSVDAALALVERCLPGWWWKIGTCHVSDDACVCPDWNDPQHAERLQREFGHLHVAGSEWDGGFDGFDVDRRPPGNLALALLEAMLSALIAIEEARETAKEVA